MAQSTKVQVVVNGKETTLGADEILVNGVKLSDFFAGYKQLQKEVRMIQRGLEAKDEHYRQVMKELI